MLASDWLVIDVMKNFYLSIIIAVLTCTCPTGHPYNTSMGLNMQIQFLTSICIHKSRQAMFNMDKNRYMLHGQVYNLFVSSNVTAEVNHLLGLRLQWSS